MPSDAYTTHEESAKKPQLSDNEITEKVKMRLNRVKARGLSDKSFFFGVANIMFTGFLVGHIPEHVWIWTMIKSVVGIPLVFRIKQLKKTHWPMVDFCWYALYLSTIMGVAMFVGVFLNPDFINQHAEFMEKAFYCFFCFATGPIGLYVAWN